ncbi:hypothetical protein BOTBODRAFT_176417 [Botryobasidium botryosum FD-172 SS1]|uniref:Uncharacterized protein n=1 Tax=Botryobasidium botryosum (strain FD-172 SS1) TaxID=930990 RepID=A0A067MKS0_BOTB1|nr:hypothetical protein BOTBODRAFT_176417 [Botryobasidium botryosum FD-172 SS1]
MRLDAADTTWARGFVKRFEKEVVESLVVSICGPDRWSTKFFSPKHREEAFNVGQKAYLWHREAQVSILTLDFEPRLVDSGLDFDEETMRLLKHNQATPSKNGPIIASVGMGLVSYRSLGEGKAKEQVWQEKVDVLMEECFT